MDVKLVLASADRDFLTAYAQFLTEGGWTVKTVFDAVQLRTAAAGGDPGICVLDERLPLGEHAESVRLLTGSGWRCLTLRKSGGPEKPAPGTAELQYPFTVRQLSEALDLLKRQVLTE